MSEVPWEFIGVCIATLLTLLGGGWGLLKRQALQEAEQKRILERLKKVEDKADEALTSKEFGDYANTNTQQFKDITRKVEDYSKTTTRQFTEIAEKVGELTGFIKGVKSRG